MSLFKSKLNNLQNLPKPESLRMDIPKLQKLTVNDERPLKNFENDFDDELREVVNRRQVPIVGGKKSLFVKIEKYDEAINHMDTIKNKLRDAQKILLSLQQIKKEEDRALQNWHSDLNYIMERVNHIDQILF